MFKHVDQKGKTYNILKSHQHNFDLNGLKYRFVIYESELTSTYRLFDSQEKELFRNLLTIYEFLINQGLNGEIKSIIECEIIDRI